MKPAPPVALTDVHGTDNEKEPYEVMKPGHHYEYISRYQDQGRNEDEYVVIDEAFVASVSSYRTSSTSSTSHLIPPSHSTRTSRLPLHPGLQVRGVGTGDREGEGGAVLPIICME